MARVAIIGENLIDLFKIDDSFEPHVGGSPLNIAVGLARGMTAATLLLDTMENESVHTVQHVVLKAKFIERESVSNI